MKINKIYIVLFTALFFSILSILLSFFYEIPYLILLRTGYIGFDRIILLQNIANFKFEFDVASFLLFAGIVCVKLMVLLFVLLFYSRILEKIFIAFYANLYKIFLGLIFFLPICIIYVWVYAMHFNLYICAGISIVVPSAISFILLLLFREMRIIDEIFSDSDIKVFTPEKER